MRMTIKNLISFVIPCYRSEKTIEGVCEEIISVVGERPEYDYEIIAVNDSSPDGVLRVLKRMAENNSRIRVIDLARNFGKHSAMMAGYSCVRGEYVVDLDDDGQCPMDEFWKLADAVVEEEYDFAAAEYETKREALWKQIGSSVNRFMVNLLLEPPKGVRIENFVVYKRFVIDEMLKYQNPYPYVDGLAMRTTHRVKMVTMQERGRADENSTGFTFKKSLSLFINGLTAFSVKPLRFATVIGLLFAALGFVFLIVIIIKRFVDPSVPVGYSSLMAVQLFSAGMIMLLLGMIGEYLGRIYISLNRSPQYVIREKINIDGIENE